jgi:hypothetical protein
MTHTLTDMPALLWRAASTLDLGSHRGRLNGYHSSGMTTPDNLDVTETRN